MILSGCITFRENKSIILLDNSEMTGVRSEREGVGGGRWVGDGRMEIEKYFKVSCWSQKACHQAINWNVDFE